MENNLQTLLEGANPWQSQQAEAIKIATKWKKSGLLEGITNEIEANNMAMILQNQAKPTLNSLINLSYAFLQRS